MLYHDQKKAKYDAWEMEHGGVMSHQEWLQFYMMIATNKASQIDTTPTQ